MPRILFPALLAGLLVACSHHPSPEPATAAKPEHIASPLDPLLKDKARAADVQRTVDDQAKKQRESEESQEQ